MGGQMRYVMADHGDVLPARAYGGRYSGGFPGTAVACRGAEGAAQKVSHSGRVGV